MDETTLLQRFNSGDSLTLGEITRLCVSEGAFWPLDIWAEQLKFKLRLREGNADG